MKNKIFIFLLSLVCFTSSSLEAKWWIFGGGEDEVGFDYLYVGDLSFDDIDTKAVLLKSSLDDGTLHIRGKGRTGKSGIGAIKISLDGSKTWKKAKFERDGGFDFSFEPDLEKSYDIYVKIIDTSGKSNDIADSHVIVSFSDLDVGDMISKTLQQLKDAYQSKNENLFMQYVSSSFEGDDATLERALRKDFSTLDEIRIDFTVSNIAFSNNKYYASVSFNRHVTTLEGTAFDDSGVTEFTFSVGEKGAMLLSMKNPLIFGLTYAEDIVSGTVASSQNSDTFLSISEDGTVETKSLEDIVSSGSSNDYSTSGTFTLQIDCYPPCNTADGFNFSNDEKTTLISDSEIYKEGNLLFPHGGSRLKDMGIVSIDGITVPDSGYDEFSGVALDIGRTVAVWLPNNTYGVVEVTNFVDLGGGSVEVSFRYKYNPGGSRTFN